MNIMCTFSPTAEPPLVVSILIMLSILLRLCMKSQSKCLYSFGYWLLFIACFFESLFYFLERILLFFFVTTHDL